jgi:hypothetical protein
MKNSKLKIKNFLLFTLLLFTFYFSFGCAKTVTNVNFDAQMVVTVTLRENADLTNNRYFMVLADTPSFKVPLPPPNNVLGGISYEFLEPDGTLPRDGTSLEAYYTNYFSTWSGYVVLDNGSYFSVPGPFLQNAPVSRPTPFAYFTPGNNKISFNLPLNRIYAIIPNNAYFDFVTVEWPLTDRKISRDHIESTNAYILTQKGSSQTILDAADPSINGSLDILTVEVTVQ